MAFFILIFTTNKYQNRKATRTSEKTRTNQGFALYRLKIKRQCNEHANGGGSTNSVTGYPRSVGFWAGFAGQK